MRKLAVLVCLALGWAAPAFAGDLSAAAQAAISRYRAEHGLPPVTADPKLMRLAAEQANAMAQAGVMDHSVARPFQARMASYGPEIAVENIAAGTKTFASTLDIWQHSAGHDANLRKAGVTRFGIALAEAPDTRYKTYWALIMAGPAKPHHGLREAGGPPLMPTAPTEGPKVRVRQEPPAEASSTDLLASLKGLLKPLLGDKK